MWTLLLPACAPEPCPAPPAAHEAIASGAVWWVRDEDLPWGGLASPCALVQGDAENDDIPGIPLDIDVDQVGLCSEVVAAASPGTVPVAGAGPARIPASRVASVGLATGGHAIALLPDEAPAVGPWVLCCNEERIYESTVVAAEVPQAPAGTAVELTEVEFDKDDSCSTGTTLLAVTGRPDFLRNGGCVSFGTEVLGPQVHCGTSPVWTFNEDLPLQDVEILNGDGTIQAATAVFGGEVP
ncbi:MAG: hypothetical protein V4850_31330 [Myxococcota bacterium]